jgi:hypothetical protein
MTDYSIVEAAQGAGVDEAYSLGSPAGLNLPASDRRRGLRGGGDDTDAPANARIPRPSRNNAYPNVP